MQLADLKRLPSLAPTPVGSVFGDWLVLREVVGAGERARLPLERVEEVARALRGALLRHALDPPPAVLSGHMSHGPPAERPHAAFVAIPALASSGSSVAGAAIVLPREIRREDFQAVLLAAARWEHSGLRLLLGRLGAMQLERPCDASTEGTPLDPAWWKAPSRHWASITPIALDRNPGKLASRDPATAARAARRAEETIARACAHIGLPKPANVCATRRSGLPGVPPASAFAPYPRVHSGLRRVCVHAELEFEEPVEGPVLLGAGRYFGVGLCQPVRPRDGSIGTGTARQANSS